jgi:hypothetical protein
MHNVSWSTSFCDVRGSIFVRRPQVVSHGEAVDDDRFNTSRSSLRAAFPLCALFPLARLRNTDRVG